MFNDTNSLMMINNLLYESLKKQSNGKRSCKIKTILNYLKIRPLSKNDSANEVLTKYYTHFKIKVLCGTIADKLASLTLECIKFNLFFYFKLISIILLCLKFIKLSANPL
jgi:hypothetical protein